MRYSKKNSITRHFFHACDDDSRLSHPGRGRLHKAPCLDRIEVGRCEPRFLSDCFSFRLFGVMKRTRRAILEKSVLMQSPDWRLIEVKPGSLPDHV
jgi:hypothetical protein